MEIRANKRLTINSTGVVTGLTVTQEVPVMAPKPPNLPTRTPVLAHNRVDSLTPENLVVSHSRSKFSFESFYTKIKIYLKADKRFFCIVNSVVSVDEMNPLINAESVSQPSEESKGNEWNINNSRFKLRCRDKLILFRTIYKFDIERGKQLFGKRYTSR